MTSNKRSPLAVTLMTVGPRLSSPFTVLSDGTLACKTGGAWYALPAERVRAILSGRTLVATPHATRSSYAAAGSGGIVTAAERRSSVSRRSYAFSAYIVAGKDTRWSIEDGQAVLALIEERYSHLQ
jgi:hypothetical protein